VDQNASQMVLRLVCILILSPSRRRFAAPRRVALRSLRVLGVLCVPVRLQDPNVQKRV